VNSDICWFLNRPASVSDAELGSYLSSGEWIDPDPKGNRNYLEAMRVGERVALKITRNRAIDLPFFTGGRPASVMTIFATGHITAVDTKSGDIAIDWKPLDQPRDWFFWTHPKPIWKVDPHSNERSQQLADFAFKGASQDIDSFLASDFWKGRYSPMPRFTWIPFYEEFATRLLDFQNDRSALIAILEKVSETEPLLEYVVHDKFHDGEFAPLIDVDPFTVIGIFNRKIKEENRQSIAKSLADALGVRTPIPEDFDGIPILNNQNSWFMSFAHRRQADDIDRLWVIFRAAQDLAAENAPLTRSTFCTAFDQAQLVRNVKWNLTVGLYWIRPTRFATLDSQSRNYLERHYSFQEATDGQSYLELCDELLTSFESGSRNITSFPLLSFAAWSGSVGKDVPNTIEGMALWAHRFAEYVDLEAKEHEYKRKAADLARQARNSVEDGTDDWAALLSKALNVTNTIDFRFKDTLKKSMVSQSDEFRLLLNQFWTEPGPEGLDQLLEDLRALLGSVTPGNATSFGALLLMAVDPDVFAPYSTMRTERWYQLTGSSRPKKQDSPSDRYAHMLEFLDNLSAAIGSEEDAESLSRLEAQGMAWTTTEYDPPEEWEDDIKADLQTWRNEVAKEPRAWLARTSNSGTQWLDSDYTSLAASYLGTLAPGSSLKEVKAAVDAAYQHQDSSQRKVLVSEHYAFLSVMKAGDLVATQLDGYLHVGVIEGPAEYVEGDGDRLRRSVLWRGSISDDEIPASVASVLARQGSIVDITEVLPDLQEILADGTLDTRVQSKAPGRDEVPVLPPVNAKLVQELHIPRVALQEIIDLLASRQQIVLYGPPGTGKTFIAKAIARHIIGADDRSRMQLVQFHPSYAYEDFFEGYRPDLTPGGEATFLLQEGPLARIAREARKNPDSPYALVIDEMNRANLAKVFGELYFLLEYRNESINLQYRPGVSFGLPRNLFIIGTMNTADRSIALLDAAMRRRFSFVELHPDEPPVNAVLDAWLKEGKHSRERARLLEALNSLIEDHDRDLRIGPSYLMRDEAETEEGLARIWKYDIMPLLEEHYYGRLSRKDIHKRFNLAAIRQVVEGGAVAQPEIVEIDDELFEESQEL
jgi:hypothetical protein